MSQVFKHNFLRSRLVLLVRSLFNLQGTRPISGTGISLTHRSHLVNYFFSFFRQHFQPLCVFRFRRLTTAKLEYYIPSLLSTPFSLFLFPFFMLV